MKKLDLTRNELMLLFLFTAGLILLIAGILLKSLLAVAGVTGLITAWFLCIDNVIANHRMSSLKLVVFGSIILLLPMFFAIYMGS
jgi:hypothetical protein